MIHRSTKILFCVVLLVLAVRASFVFWRPTDIVLIPNGYIGWVRINYDVNGQPPLRKVWFAYRIEIPADGRIATSSSLASGLATDQYYYVNEHGQKKLLKIANTADSPDGNIRAFHYFTIPQMKNEQARQFRIFFVGTAADYQRARKDQDYLLSL